MSSLLNKFKSKKFEYEINDNNMVILGDSIKVLSCLKEKSVDLIFADPPYNLGDIYGKDFGEGKVNFNKKEGYIKWCKEWIDKCFDILKDNGTFYIMNATQFIPYIDIYMQENYNIVSRIIWNYDSSGRQAKNYFGSLYEPILMCTKTKNADYTFNSEDILVEAKTGAKRQLIDYRKDPPQPYNTEKVPGNVWKINRVRYRMKEYRKHPSQKPEKLLNRIILASSNEDEVVLDPFSGTFTTSAVAQKLNRKTIGIDVELDYYKYGLERLGLTNKNMKLFK